MILLFAAAYLRGINVPKLALASPDALDTGRHHFWRDLAFFGTRAADQTVSLKKSQTGVSRSDEEVSCARAQ